MPPSVRDGRCACRLHEDLSGHLDSLGLRRMQLLVGSGDPLGGPNNDRGKGEPCDRSKELDRGLEEILGL